MSNRNEGRFCLVQSFPSLVSSFNQPANSCAQCSLIAWNVMMVINQLTFHFILFRIVLLFFPSILSSFLNSEQNAVSVQFTSNCQWVTYRFSMEINWKSSFLTGYAIKQCARLILLFVCILDWIEWISIFTSNYIVNFFFIWIYTLQFVWKAATI